MSASATQVSHKKQRLASCRNHDSYIKKLPSATDTWRIFKWVVSPSLLLISSFVVLGVENVPICILPSQKKNYWPVFTERRNARIESAVLATAIPSVRPYVCLSVCPSHAGIVSKRRHVARCSLHCWCQNVSSFAQTKKYSPGTTPSPWNFGSKWHVLPCSASTVSGKR